MKLAQILNNTTTCRVYMCQITNLLYIAMVLRCQREADAMFLGIITSNCKVGPTIWVPAGIKINTAAPLDYAIWNQDCQSGMQGDCARCWRHEGQDQHCLAGAGA